VARRIVGNGESGQGPVPLKALIGAHLEDRALGFGSGKAGTPAGRANAVYADVDLTGVPDLTNVVVRHALGETPTVCEYVGARNSGASVFAVVSPVDRAGWTHSTVRIAVSLTGPQADTVLTLRVGGE
jgi:hypothetical protein